MRPRELMFTSDIESVKANRFRFLHLLYEKSGADEYNWMNMHELGRELGLDERETQRIVQYLVGEILIVHRAIGGTIGITHKGVVEVEKAKSNPKEATSYFPALVNIVEIHGDVHGDAQIQQATQNSQQLVTADSKGLAEFLQAVERELPGLNLDEKASRDLTAEIDTIKAQMKASNPKQSIIREALALLKLILEGAGATILATEAAKLLGLLH